MAIAQNAIIGTSATRFLFGTSTGYGVGAGGVAALHAMLSSCAPGVVVVNIDNGYGAGVHAARIARAAHPPSPPPPHEALP